MSNRATSLFTTFSSDTPRTGRQNDGMSKEIRDLLNAPRPSFDRRAVLDLAPEPGQFADIVKFTFVVSLGLMTTSVIARPSASR